MNAKRTKRIKKDRKHEENENDIEERLRRPWVRALCFSFTWSVEWPFTFFCVMSLSVHRKANKTELLKNTTGWLRKNWSSGVNYIAQPNFSRDFYFFGLCSRCAVLFFKVFKKVEKNKIEYIDLRSKCNRIYSDTKLAAKQYHLEVVLIYEWYRFAVVFNLTSNRLQNDII